LTQAYLASCGFQLEAGRLRWRQRKTTAELLLALKLLLLDLLLQILLEKQVLMCEKCL
jgi:hypothetical protein